MKKLLENIAHLFKVKTIVTLVVIAVFAYLALTGAIAPDNVMIIISMVVSFYFGTQHEKTSVGVPTVAPAISMIGTVTESAAARKEETVDPATYNQTHPDASV